MVEIEEYQEKDIGEISDMIIRNIMEVDIKDYGKEEAKKLINKYYTKDKLKEEFKERTKVYVAKQNGTIVGTAGIDKSWYNDDGEYWILSVFVKPENHKKGIGTKLIKKVEEYAKEINAKKLIVPATITGCEFYRKNGYKYVNDRKELNKENMYMMEKIWN
jgi:N-acetylglutamate synthase-like GNAT family acetyltransferase